LGEGPRFWLLIALLVVLTAAYVLAKDDVTAVYNHLTRHAPGWAKRRIPSGNVGVVVGGDAGLPTRRGIDPGRDRSGDAENASRSSTAQCAAQRPSVADKLPGHCSPCADWRMSGEAVL
jgi:hypothetical protein